MPETRLTDALIAELCNKLWIHGRRLDTALSCLPDWWDTCADWPEAVCSTAELMVVRLAHAAQEAESEIKMMRRAPARRLREELASARVVARTQVPRRVSAAQTEGERRSRAGFRFAARFRGEALIRLLGVS